MSDRCGYRWRAPWIAPPTADPIDVAYYRKHRPPQVCIKPRGHAGDHEDWSKITTSQQAATLGGKTEQ